MHAVGAYPMGSCVFAFVCFLGISFEPAIRITWYSGCGLFERFPWSDFSCEGFARLLHVARS